MRPPVQEANQTIRQRHHDEAAAVLRMVCASKGEMHASFYYVGHPSNPTLVATLQVEDHFGAKARTLGRSARYHLDSPWYARGIMKGGEHQIVVERYIGSEPFDSFAGHLRRALGREQGLELLRTATIRDVDAYGEVVDVDRGGMIARLRHSMRSSLFGAMPRRMAEEEEQKLQRLLECSREELEHLRRHHRKLRAILLAEGEPDEIHEEQLQLDLETYRDTLMSELVSAEEDERPRLRDELHQVEAEFVRLGRHGADPFQGSHLDRATRLLFDIIDRQYEFLEPRVRALAAQSVRPVEELQARARRIRRFFQEISPELETDRELEVEETEEIDRKLQEIAKDIDALKVEVMNGSWEVSTESSETS